MKEFSKFLEPSEEPASRFVGRERELVSLDKALFDDKSKVVGIVGAVGVGKTALILEFVRRRKNRFPGGVYHFPLIISRDIFNSSLDFIPNSNKPILVILEELGSLPDAIARSYTLKILNERPSTQILYTSQIIHASNFTNNFVDNLIELKTLDYSDAEILRNLKKSSYLQVEPFYRATIIGPDGRVLEKDSKSFKQIITNVTEVDFELLKTLAKHPDLLYELSPRKFEEVIAELLHRQGYEVQMTPFTKDGGVDIYAAIKNTLGTYLFLVQCKKYAPNHPVGVELVRELYGVVQSKGATAGIITATSHFTKGAKDFQSQLLYRLDLKDYIGIQNWLRSIPGLAMV